MTMYLDTIDQFEYAKNFQKELDKMQNELFTNTHLENVHYQYPRLNVKKEKLDDGLVKYYIEQLIPGFNKKDVKIEVVDNNTLVIKGERKVKEKKELKEEFVEFNWLNSFYRKILIPNIQLDSIEAKVTDGILKIELISGKRQNRKEIEIE